MATRTRPSQPAKPDNIDEQTENSDLNPISTTKQQVEHYRNDATPNPHEKLKYPDVPGNPSTTATTQIGQQSCHDLPKPVVGNQCSPDPTLQPRLEPVRETTYIPTQN